MDRKVVGKNYSPKRLSLFELSQILSEGLNLCETFMDVTATFNYFVATAGR